MRSIDIRPWQEGGFLFTGPVGERLKGEPPPQNEGVSQPQPARIRRLQKCPPDPHPGASYCLDPPLCAILVSQPGGGEGCHVVPVPVSALWQCRPTPLPPGGGSDAGEAPAWPSRGAPASRRRAPSPSASDGEAPAPSRKRRRSPARSPEAVPEEEPSEASSEERSLGLWVSGGGIAGMPAVVKMWGRDKKAHITKVAIGGFRKLTKLPLMKFFDIHF